MKLALLVIDLQNDCFVNNALTGRKGKLVNRTNELVDEAHRRNIPIIWIRQEWKADLSDAPLHNKRNNKFFTIENTDGCKFLAELHREALDYEIVKKRFSSFFKTNLEELLRKLDVDTLIISGVNTMTCVRTTAIDAYQRDFDVILALEAVDGYDQEQHESSLKYLQYSIVTGKSNPEIIEIMRS